MLPSLSKRLFFEPSPPLVKKFLYNFAWKGALSVKRLTKRSKRGEVFPAFPFISVTNRCNLHCKGCWLRDAETNVDLDSKTLLRIIGEFRSQGCHFFGILGGEPLLYPGLTEVFAKAPDCYFLLFTNGTLITAGLAGKLRKLGNVSPLLSIEGGLVESDRRRGGSGVYNRTLEGLELCKRNRLITGVATSVCSSNINELVSKRFVRELVDRRVHYLWYYIYRPVGPDPSPDLALSSGQILRLRRFLVDIRNTAPLLIIDSYWNHKGEALCPAATGISHHIAPSGLIEPCPPVQLARDSAATDRPLYEVLTRSGFLREFRRLACDTTKGCILMEKPQLLRKFARREGAYDSSGRGTMLEELSGMNSFPSHHIPGMEIPESHWFYKFLKKYWFFGFGAYG